MGEKVIQLAEKESDLIEECQDLPPEILKELSISYKNGGGIHASRKVLKKVTELIADGNGMTTDQIIVAAWRADKTQYKRNSLNTALNNLVNDGKLSKDDDLWSLPS